MSCIGSSSWCLRWLFFFKQKTAYEMRISDWSSDVCSSDLGGADQRGGGHRQGEDGDQAAVPRDDPVVDDVLGQQRADDHQAGVQQIGRASCRERVCQYV